MSTFSSGFFSSINHHMAPVEPTQSAEGFSPKLGPPKSVSIAEPTEEFQNPNTSQDYQPPPGFSRQHRASIGKKLSGRPVANASTASLGSLADSGVDEGYDRYKPSSSHLHHQGHHVTSRVKQWLDTERARKTARRQKRSQKIRAKDGIQGPQDETRTTSDSDSDALARLEQILADAGLDEKDLLAPARSRRSTHGPRKRSSKYSLRRKSTAASSDTDYADGDVLVPSADVVLDNIKTLKYSNPDSAESTTDLHGQAKRKEKEKAAWLTFKNEIVRLAHTLKLKDWRRVPLEHGGEITVERLSGAMTNAVYVVSPPTTLPNSNIDTQDSNKLNAPRRTPPKLLLRIYGPQVEHLIDRESELGILRRLARKRIGPRLLGTFSNGRFEQFFQARTLTADDLRVPETSKHIAKRMRELHEGVELMEEERIAGAFVWQNWDKWVERCEEIIPWLDKQITSKKLHEDEPANEAWRGRGLVCGVEWPMFRKMVEKYRAWLENQYGGSGAIRDQLVFSHNDTQYGNLLRLQPSGESPLLTPANEHKQLIVIDFEYANANVPGLEFANHFTEWCYNYHDPKVPYAVHEKVYPTPEEQRRFVKAYVTHKPAFPSTAVTPAATTPAATPSAGPSTSVTSFMLDARTPYSQFQEEDSKENEVNEKEIAKLLRDTKNWRMACSAQWVAWGIVQAKVEGMEEALGQEREISTNATSLSSDAMSPETAGLARDVQDKRPEGLIAEALIEGKTVSAVQEDDEGEFDYLGYAQERAMFFWGDVLQIGLVKREELPENLLKKVKIVEY